MATSPVHALFPGTFDPVTLGHLDLARRAAGMFDRLTICVALHHDKKAMFSPDERLGLLREVLDEGGLQDVAVAGLEGLLVDGARDLGAAVVVRGVRGAVDLEYERQMVLTNRMLAPELETVFLLPDAAHGHISSTLVRQIAGMGGDVSAMVPAAVLRALRGRS